MVVPEYVLFPVSVAVELFVFVTDPVPVISLETVMSLSVLRVRPPPLRIILPVPFVLLLNSRLALVATVVDPVVVLLVLVRASVPLLISVPPV